MGGPSRRQLLKEAVLATAATSIGGTFPSLARAENAPSSRPTARSGAKNVLLIVADQLRPDILASYGGRICQTPVLDALAGRSVVFDRAYTPLPVCSPARASMLTGVYPHTHEVLSNEYPLGKGTIKDSPTLLSRRLEALGYQNWMIGKWHLGNGQNLPQRIGLPGHQFGGHGSGGYQYDEYQQYLRRKGLAFTFTDGPHQLGHHLYGTLAGPEESEVSAFLADDTIAFLDRWDETRERPFFLWVNFWGPHEPYYATQKYMDLYRDVPIPPWDTFVNTDPLKPRSHQLQVPPESRGKGWAFWETAVRHYFAFMSLIDHQIGRILDRLRQLNLEQETLVIFTADHGETLGSHGGIQNKGYAMYEEIMRVPLMIQSAGLAPRRERALVSLNDLCPTILASAGESDPERGRHGKSLLPLLRDGHTAWRSTLGGEFHGLQAPYTQRMIVNERYKYVWNIADTDELYDLQADPREMHNRIADSAMSGLRGEMQEAMRAWMKETGDDVQEFFEWHMDHPAPTELRREMRAPDHIWRP